MIFQGYGGLRLMADSLGGEENPPVVFLPALGQTKELWHGAAQALAEAGRFAICLDPRGHGHSARSNDAQYDLDAYAHDIRGVLAQLSSRATIVAVGLSGLAALVAVGEHPAPLVSSLVLVGVTPWVDEAAAERITEAMSLRTRKFGTKEEALAAVAAIHPFEPEPRNPQRLLQAFEIDEDGQYHWRCDHRVLQRFDFTSLSARLEAAAARVSVPVTLIRGTTNESVSRDATQRLQNLIPSCEVAEIVGGGHYVATDFEEEFNAILIDFLERKAPRAPLIYQCGADPRVLRDALGCFGTGVTIVTTMDSAGNPIGLTANSFTSVSLDPPLILFCLAGTSASLATFRLSRRFAINVLHIGQQPASARFARRDGARFEGLAWNLQSKTGSPILPGSLASFDCQTYSVQDAGDHVVFIGEIVYAYFEPHRDPLLYFRGKYRRLHIA